MLSDADRHDLLRDLAANPDGAWITVAGRSMEPTLHIGDRVHIRRCPSIRPGDVVLFETRDRRAVILHRVIAKLPGIPWFVHIGDGGNPSLPGLATTHAVIGRADVPRRRVRLRSYVAAIRRVLRGP
jgi:signal peptidase I